MVNKPTLDDKPKMEKLRVTEEKVMGSQLAGILGQGKLLKPHHGTLPGLQPEIRIGDAQPYARSKQRSHYFTGMDEAALVTRWLNNPARPANDGVEQLIAAEVRFQSGDPDAGRETIELINQAVRIWKLGTAPVASFSESKGRTISQKSTADTRKAPPAQSLAFSKAVELMQANLLTRVRRCKREGCGVWFFAVLDRAIYHTDECRTQSVTGSEGFRERRRRYMRKRRMGKKGGN